MTAIEFSTFPITAHQDYAINQEYSQKHTPTLKSYSRSLPSIPGSISKNTSSNLESIPFFHSATLSWSFFPAPPPTLNTLSFFYSQTYYTHVRTAHEKLKEFLSTLPQGLSPIIEHEKTKLSCLFKLHENLETLSNFIDSKRTMQKA